VIIELKTPITAHGELRSQIEMRDPTPADVELCGYPIKGLAGGGGGPDPTAISALIARLGNIPPSSVKALSMRDWNSCMAGLMRFFGEPEEEDSPSEPSTSLLSGNGTLGTH